MNIDEEKAGFNAWLAVMPRAIQRFIGSLPDTVRPHMDFSPASLDVLERWLLETFHTVAELRAPERKELWDGLGRYIGETFIRNVGGRWEIRLDDPTYVYHAVPQITGYSARPTPICPHVLSTVAVDRKRGLILRSTVQNALDKKLHQQ